MAYTQVGWENLPNTTTPVNKSNLKHMDDGIKNNDDKLTETNERLQYGYKGANLYYESMDAFKADLITNNYPEGAYILFINLGGSVNCLIVQKANNNYLSFLQFNYASPLKQYTFFTPNWSEITYS